MKDSDYYVKMLRIYFTDNNIFGYEKKLILNDNPFNYQFVNWEENYSKANRLIAESIKEHKLLIDNKYPIEEIDFIEEESISKYLENYKKIYYNYKGIKTILVHDTLIGKTRLPDILNKPHFILGLSTNNYDAYKKRLKYYEKIINNSKKVHIIESYDEGFNTCVIHK